MPRLPPVRSHLPPSWFPPLPLLAGPLRQEHPSFSPWPWRMSRHCPRAISHLNANGSPSTKAACTLLCSRSLYQGPPTPLHDLPGTPRSPGTQPEPPRPPNLLLWLPKAADCAPAPGHGRRGRNREPTPPLEALSGTASTQPRPPTAGHQNGSRSSPFPAAAGTRCGATSVKANRTRCSASGVPSPRAALQEVSGGGDTLPLCPQPLPVPASPPRLRLGSSGVRCSQGPRSLEPQRLGTAALPTVQQLPSPQ